MPSLTIELGGRTYQGVWFQHAPGAIELRSEYGARQAYLDGRDPGSVATEVLREIVDAACRTEPTRPSRVD